MLVRIANREDPDQTASWVFAVCLGLFDMQLVFKILEHSKFLPYLLENLHI